MKKKISVLFLLCGLCISLSSPAWAVEQNAQSTAGISFVEGEVPAKPTPDNPKATPSTPSGKTGALPHTGEVIQSGVSIVGILLFVGAGVIIFRKKRGQDL